MQHLNELMHDLLEYGRPAELAMDEVSLDEIARTAIAQSAAAASKRGVEVRLEHDEVPPVRGDKGKLRQALRNVIENAVAFSGRGDTVWVQVRNDGARVRCEVADSGPGLSSKQLAHAFQPFYTNRKGGTGLGLAIAQKIVTAHGGEIMLANRPSGGAVVTIRLPAASDDSDREGDDDGGPAVG